MSNEAQPPVNLFAAQQQSLRERLYLLLSSVHPALQADAKRAFEEPGKLLFQSSLNESVTYPGRPAGMWSLLTFLVAQHISPRIDPVLTGDVAIATECFACALDLLDDVEDEDQTAILNEIGIARALNLSTALLALAQRSLLSASQRGVDQDVLLRLLSTMQQTLQIATSGQHHDLLAEQRQVGDLTREECIEIAAAKAGAIMRLACLSGAICAGASEIECAEFAEMGELLGIAHQLDNDAHDLYYLVELANASQGIALEKSKKNRKSDLARGKKTLPFVVAAGIHKALQKKRALTDGEEQEYVQALREGIMTTWAISLLYRERADERLRAISSRKPLAPALHLLLGFE